jgi:hypothetical protein
VGNLTLRKYQANLIKVNYSELLTGSQWALTGVKSRSSSASVAEVAASIKSSQRLPWTQAAVGGSAENAFRPSILIRLANSFDFVLSCFDLRAFCVMDDFLGLDTLSLRWIGGRVDERPGGEWPKIDGSSSRGREVWNEGRGSCFRWSRKGGSSIEDLIR